MSVILSEDEAVEIFIKETVLHLTGLTIDCSTNNNRRDVPTHGNTGTQPEGSSDINPHFRTHSLRAQGFNPVENIYRTLHFPGPRDDAHEADGDGNNNLLKPSTTSVEVLICRPESDHLQLTNGSTITESPRRAGCGQFVHIVNYDAVRN